MNFCSGSNANAKGSKILQRSNIQLAADEDVSVHTMTVRELLHCLKCIGAFGASSKQDLNTALAMVNQALFKDAEAGAELYFNLETQVIFPEFVEVCSVLCA